MSTSETPILALGRFLAAQVILVAAVTGACGSATPIRPVLELGLGAPEAQPLLVTRNDAAVTPQDGSAHALQTVSPLDLLPLSRFPALSRTAMMGMAGMMASTAAASAVPMPLVSFATLIQAHDAMPVVVKLHDENLELDATVLIDHDGTTDDATAAELQHLFRCRSTHRERPMARETLAMLADLAEKYDGKTIEFVSAYRAQRGESKTSPHRDGRALDFRIRGVQLREIRDYLWRKYTSVGIGWYPSEQFIHMDTRPHDMSWTFFVGVNHYHPYWSELARRTEVAATHAHPPGA